MSIVLDEIIMDKKIKIKVDPSDDYTPMIHPNYLMKEQIEISKITLGISKKSHHLSWAILIVSILILIMTLVGVIIDLGLIK